MQPGREASNEGRKGKEREQARRGKGKEGKRWEKEGEGAGLDYGS
jgi:hypothetical protein